VIRRDPNVIRVVYRASRGAVAGHWVAEIGPTMTGLTVPAPTGELALERLSVMISAGAWSFDPDWTPGAAARGRQRPRR